MCAICLFPKNNHSVMLMIYIVLVLFLSVPAVLCCCFGNRKGIRPVKHTAESVAKRLLEEMYNVFVQLHGFMVKTVTEACIILYVVSIIHHFFHRDHVISCTK